MKTRTLGLALAGTLLAGLTVAADLPAPADDHSAPGFQSATLKGDVYTARRDWAAARDAYREAIEGSATLHNKLGICHHRLGDLDAARQAYATAVRLQPDYAEAWNNLGTIDHARRAYEAAIFDYQKSAALNPTNPVVFRNLGLAFLALDDVEATLEAWSQALRLDPKALTGDEEDSVSVAQVDYARKYYLYAKLVAAQGDVDRALEFLGLARDHGLRDFGKVARDPDFASVVQDPRWASWSH
jgi:tetratricopeptide (TPR) repeat protein